jgi:hypothetical protein
VTGVDVSVVAERCAAQQLGGSPAGSAVAVVRRLLAVQGQDPRGVRLAIRARSAGLTAADVDQALTQDRSLLITWLNRGTLHLVTAEDYWWLHALTTPRMTASIVRRLGQEGSLTPQIADRASAVIDAALASEGPLTRAQLAERMSAAGIRTQGQALVHLLAWASQRGEIVRGPMAAGAGQHRQHAFVRVADWLGPRPSRFEPAAFDRDLALAELARRYLVGHGPAAERDLAYWAGLPLGDARRGLTTIAGELRDRDDGLAQLAASPAGDAELPRPMLLGPFDPLLHGWPDREPILGPHKHIVTVNGLFRPFALASGRAVATWTLARGQVAIEPLEPLARPVDAALRADASDVLRYLG